MSVYQLNVLELAPNAVRTTTFTGAAVDIRDYNGTAKIILSTSAATAGTAPTLDVTIEESATSGGAYTAIAGAAFAQVTAAADLTEMIAIQSGATKGFIRAVGTIGGTATPTFGFGVVMLGTLQSGRNASQAI